MLWNCFAVRVSEWNARLNWLEKKKEKLTLLLHNRLALFLKFPFPVQVEQTYSDHTLCKHIWRRAELEFMIVHSFSSFILFTFVSLPQFIGLLFCYLNRCYSVLFLLPSCSPIFFLWVRFFLVRALIEIALSSLRQKSRSLCAHDQANALLSASQAHALHLFRSTYNVFFFFDIALSVIS